MSVLFIAVPVALSFALGAVLAFLWASRSGQLDDLETPPLRMLEDEGRPASPQVGRPDAAQRARAARAEPNGAQ